MSTHRTRGLFPTLLAAALLGGAAPGCGEDPSSPQPSAPSRFPATEDLRTMLRYLVEDGGTPGIVLGILEPDGSTRIVHYGSAGPGTRPLGPRTVFEIGSINKTFTGTVLAHMAARGEVKLDDPVQQYLPANVRVPSRNGRQITLLDLATHRSGLPLMPNNVAPADPANPFADYSAERLYAFLSGYQLTRDIGARYEYSNVGVALLGHALGRAAGGSTRTLIRERILEPLGMRMTSYDRADVAEWLARGHNDAGGVVPYWDLSDAVAGAAGLRSSMEDMLLYLGAQVGPPDTELERAIRDAHQVRHRVSDQLSMGLGWAVRTTEGRTLLSHGGGTAGFRAWIAFDPEQRTGFVLLANSGGFDDDIGQDFLLRGPPPALRELQVEREVLALYAGEYQLAPGRSAIVRLEEEGTLTLRMPQSVRVRMYAESDSAFVVKREPWRVRFTRDVSGAVTAMRIEMNGTEQTAPRVSDRAPTPRQQAVPSKS
jgi:D-alanyl-D-alanine-carboxypeptidase/D-alanyl-D-alanine-endopeptidase